MSLVAAAMAPDIQTSVTAAALRAALRLPGRRRARVASRPRGSGEALLAVAPTHRTLRMLWHLVHTRIRDDDGPRLGRWLAARPGVALVPRTALP